MKYIKFDNQYNIAELKRDLAICLENQWSDHYNQRDYLGTWQSISLRSASGAQTDIYANYGVKEFKDTPLLSKVSYIKSIVDSFKCEKETIRLLALHPGSEIKPHRDPGCSYIDGNLRIHIPIQTNCNVHFDVDGERLILSEGSCWYIDFGLSHSIRNDSDSVRIHLVIDAIRNDWTDQLFKKHGYNFDAESAPKVYDERTTALMIEALEKMNTDTAKKLIENLRKRS